jgi:pimeloyl-ACP methyl ester carboxylesterase
MRVDTFHPPRFHPVRFADAGVSGVPVILLHGFCENWQIWEPTVRALAHTNRVIAVDLLGHNPEVDSDAEASGIGSFTLEDMAWCVAELLTFLHIDHAVWVGHSMGGYATLQALRLFPERIAAACLFHSMPFADTDEGKRNRMRSIELIQAGNKAEVIEGLVQRTFGTYAKQVLADHVRFTQELMMRVPRHGMISALKAMRDRTDTTHVLQQMTQPLLMILGKEDPIVPMQRMLELLPVMNSRAAMACVLQRSAHMGMVEEAETSIRAIRSLVMMV